MQSKAAKNFISGRNKGEKQNKVVNMENLETPPSQFLEISDNL
jgi:hypothetical protein